jgi:hypothetical protein
MDKYKGPPDPIPTKSESKMDSWVVVISLVALAFVLLDVFVWSR